MWEQVLQQLLKTKIKTRHKLSKNQNRKSRLSSDRVSNAYTNYYYLAHFWLNILAKYAMFSPLSSLCAFYKKKKMASLIRQKDKGV